MRISRSTGFISGLLLIALGIWGAAVPFIGPYFHYAFGTTSTWHYSTNRLVLDILPGVVVAVGGALMLTTGHRLSGAVASWLAIIGGAWFAVGPAFSRIWEHGSAPIGGPLYGSTRQAIELIGYFYGLGALVVALAAFALGRFVSRPGLVLEPAAAAEPVAVSPEPAAAAEPAAVSPEPVAAVSPEPIAAAEPAAVSPEPVAVAPAPAFLTSEPHADHEPPTAPAVSNVRAERDSTAPKVRETSEGRR